MNDIEKPWNRVGGLFKPKDEFELEFLVGTLVGYLLDRPLPSSTGPLFQNEGRCSAFDMEIISVILMQIKLIFTRKVMHLAPFWKWGFLELGSSLLDKPFC